MEKIDKLLNNILSLGLPEDVLKNPSIVIEGHKVVKEVPYPGILLEKKVLDDRIKVSLKVLPNITVEKPVHMCLSKLSPGDQLIDINIDIGENSKVKIVSHCAFKGKNIKHISRTNFRVRKGASLEVSEIHYHEKDIDILIDAKSEGVVEEKGSYKSLFKIDSNNAGKVRIEYTVDILDYATADIETKIAGRDGDDIYVKDIMYLKGKYSKAIAKSRLMALGNTKAEFYGETYGFGDYSRGHIDCSEIVRGNEVTVKAIPIVVVNNETAKVTHEAAVGSIDKKQLETLMAKGLDEDEAVDVIVKGMLG
ncbi:SufB/SufD family protein [Desulfurobacterium thermolithotrophum]|uniref:SufB/SufD family protein n=1 Tax=Desulfurobacterium thermolithotrophum TaxID=64160 RepID=UPI0013D275DA|nr:SufD family Fe-S cluster assembly protein [Desulfurobacterium thermolithotrophum]